MIDAVRDLLGRHSPPVAALAGRVYALVLDVYPDAVVTVDGNDIGFGRTTGYTGLVFTLAPHTKHVTLGVAGGATMPDPAGLLEGAGRVHRHVKIRSDADLDRPELRALMEAAVARAS